jgi:hypothetical protein
MGRSISSAVEPLFLHLERAKKTEVHDNTFAKQGDEASQLHSLQK